MDTRFWGDKSANRNIKYVYYIWQVTNGTPVLCNVETKRSRAREAKRQLSGVVMIHKHKVDFFQSATLFSTTT
ncbi:hypothetical protein LCGC14_0629980 [marine sediment metagenome]|uniref:Uncharacterized protein n=1 Tax=marine sediment metagenome TaxID=412755 RepID=A0A0F9TNR0_9ZZZZ